MLSRYLKVLAKLAHLWPSAAPLLPNNNCRNKPEIKCESPHLKLKDLSLIKTSTHL